MKLAITDDDQLIVDLLESFLNTVESYEVIFSSNNGEKLLAFLKETELVPDVILLDLKMNTMDGVEVAAQVKTIYPEIRIVILSSFYKQSFIGFMLKSGINAFLPKGLSPEELPPILNEVYQHGFYFTPDQIEVLKDQLSSRLPKPIFEAETLLTGREKDVLKLICAQMTAKEIGEKLFITQRTVEGHKNNLLLKTGVKNTAGLVLYAIQQGLVNTDEILLI